MLKWSGYSLLLLLFCACVKEFPDVQTKVMGHAGESLLPARSDYPPNTLQSIQKAIDLGAQGVEVDVQMTADGILVAYHDSFLDDNSTGTGCINDQTLSAVAGIKVYKSDITIPLLTEVLALVIPQNKYLMLDIKHHNFCTESHINYAQFNFELNTILSSYSPQQKDLITANCTDPNLLLALTDTSINRSIESDDPETAIATAKNYGFDMLTLKLTVLTPSIRDQIENDNLILSIFNVKTRSEINKALQYDPEFVISDNLQCTLKAIHGK